MEELHRINGYDDGAGEAHSWIWVIR